MVSNLPRATKLASGKTDLGMAQGSNTSILSGVIHEYNV